MKNNKNRQGFTLIEVMVAIVIFLIVMAASYTIFDAQQKSYITQRDVAAMQQNLRTGMYMLGRDIKMANCYLGELGIGYHDDNVHDKQDPTDVGYIKGITAWDDYDDQGSDVIDIAYSSFTVHTTLRIEMPKSSANLKVELDSMPDDKDGTCATTNSEGRYQECFKDNDLIVISDGIHSNLMQVTQVGKTQGDPHILHAPGQSDLNYPANKNWDHDGYTVDSRVFKIKYISYKIDRSDPEHPQLSYCHEVMPGTDPDSRTLKDDNGDAVKDADGSDVSCYQPIAENIEDIQFAYLLTGDDPDDLSDDLHDFDGPHSDANDKNTDSDGNFPNVRAVRVSIVARSDRPFPYYNGKKPLLENGTEGSDDHYMRRVYTAEFEARNLSLDTD
ncbi:MAG: prepilin-type N-terminal cleavage/methylation domain-containing protein [Desulfobacteraceae bacterium]|nr:prepilin-type N-terminal cleavage/methylation domain-containing protein [Desulfobacteraceae bacterium]